MEPASTKRLERLLRPRTIAVIGGGGWCANLVEQCDKIGFKGKIWPVHPTRSEVSGRRAFASIDALPGVPDATFIGVNRHATVELVAALSARGAGGAICFASGFQEAVAELSDGADLQAQLLVAAGAMPILGPNCYGLINALDGAVLWPDQHGAVRVERGVAIVTQSSNIAINLTMQKRGLPIAYIVTVGNQAQTDLAEIGTALLEDPRVTALGLHIEGIGKLRRFEALAETARRLGKRIVALKVGASEQAQVATVSHTASIAGSDVGARAVLARLGIGQVSSLSVLLETLKLLHVTGPLASNRIASMSCSGGEASLMADTALGRDVIYPPLSVKQASELRAALGPRVALANPLDYHTYIWGDRTAMAACFSAMMAPDLALGVVILDFPRPDRCVAAQWEIVIDAVGDAQALRGVPMAIVASLPESLPEDTATRIMARGIAALSGLPDALDAIAVAAQNQEDTLPLLLPGPDGATRILSEAEAKAALSVFGIPVPRAVHAISPADAAVAAQGLTGLLVLKGEGFVHKTEAGAIRLGLQATEIAAAAQAMGTSAFLIEEMIDGAVVELLVSALRDPAHGFVLTLGEGGTFTELLADTTHLLVPTNPKEITAALSRLRLAPRIDGYRGAPAADRSAIVSAVLAVQDYVIAHAGDLFELEINPLLCTPTRAVAADALIRLRDLP
ncbi:MAG: acetate--CoA ligase family protein [Rhodobacterales bacterium]|nr:acetate--CoA ligase family protein [Rhodobacterales bacterium]